MRLSAFCLLLIIIPAVYITGDAQKKSKQRQLPTVDTVTTAELHQIIQQNNGGITMVNAWATWCDPCKKEIPALLKLREKYKNKNFNLILVSADDLELAKTKVPRTLAKYAVAFQTYIKNDSTDEAFIMGMSPDWNGALPTSFLYDTEGKLVDMMIGERSYEQFEAAIKQLLGK